MEPKSKNVSVVDTPVAKAWLEPGIFCYSPKDVARTQKAMEENYRLVYGLLKKPTIWLMDLPHSNPVDKNCREYIAAHLKELCSELVIIAEKPVSKIMAAFFKRMESSEMPVTIFSSEDGARAYIKEKMKGKRS